MEAADRVVRPPRTHFVGTGSRRVVLALLSSVAAVGCGAFGPVPLDVPPGHRAVLGRVDLLGEVTEGTLDIVKDDRTFEHALPVGQGPGDFALVLPPGRYRIVRFRGAQQRQSVRAPVWELALAFEAGPEPAVYIGTLRLAATYGRAPRVAVTDEYEATLRTLRTWYSDLPAVVARRLLVPP